MVKLEFAMSRLKYPKMREELVEYLRGLADIAYQQQVWVNGTVEGSVQHDELDYSIHFLFDDTELASDPYSLIGWILHDESEADQILKLTNAIEEIFSKYGTRLSDAQYISLPEWMSVIDCANEALAALAIGDL